MITEKYVSFEVAKLLKEKGFVEPCLYYYFTNGKIGKAIGLKDKNTACVSTFSAPTHQMATDWLDEKGCYISIMPFYVKRILSESIVKFVANVFVKHPDYFEDHSIGVFDSRQEATEAAMMDILVKLPPKR